MSVEKKIYPRWIKDPLFTPIKKFLNNRLKVIDNEGDLTDRLLAEDRYQGMRPEDFVAEDVSEFKDGIKRFCLVRRNKRFARVDLELEQVRLREIFADQSVPFIVINTLSEFIKKFKLQEVQGKLLYLVWRDAFGVCLDNAEAMNLTKIDELFNHVYFDKLTLERIDETTINSDTLTSGVVRIEDRTCSDKLVHVFVTENIIDELALDRIVDNFPLTITSKRGETINHLMKIQVGDEDVTSLAILSFSTVDNRVNCTRSSNKLESIFKIIRGDKIQALSETITIHISVNFMGEVFTKDAEIAVNILPDTVSQLELIGYPVSIEVPSGRQVGVIVKGKFGNNPITFTQIPNQLTSLTTGINLISQGNYRGGVLFVGTYNTSVPSGTESLDLVKGVFNYFVNGVTHTNTAFIDIVVNPIDPNYPNLVNTLLQPNGLTGEVGIEYYFRYKNSLKGVNIPTTQLDLPTTELGPKRLLKFTKTTTDRVYYTFVNNSGKPGVIETDTVMFNARYIDPVTGLIHTRQDYVYPNVIYPSELALTPYSPSPVIGNKYEYGNIPFKITVNGIEDPSKITDITISDPAHLVKNVLFSGKDKGTWQILNTGEAVVTTPVDFEVTFAVDNASKKAKGTKLFTVNPWTGSEIGVLPTQILIVGKAGEQGTFKYSFFKNETLVNQGIKFIPELSTIPAGLSITPKATVNDQFVEASYQLHVNGNYSGHLVFSMTDGLTPADTISVPFTANIAPGEELFFTVTGITEAKPLLPGEVHCQVTYKGVNIPINDPRIGLDISLPNESQGIIAIGNKTPTGFLFTSLIDNIPMGGSVIYDLSIDLNFVDDTGETLIRTKEAGIMLKRSSFNVINAILITDPIKANVNDQVILIKLLDPDGDPIPGAGFERVSFVNKPDKLGPIQSYRNSMVERRTPTTLGQYEFKATTNHFGGDVYMGLKVSVGGMVLDVTTPAIHVPVAPIKTATLNNGVAVNNVRTTIYFTMFQDKLNTLNVPVIRKDIDDIVFSEDHFRLIENVTMLDTLGNYKMDVVSSGSIGLMPVSFTVYTSENNNTVDVTWDATLNINMTRD